MEGERTPDRTRAELLNRAERGARFLDEREPGWYLRLDRGQLDLATNQCVVGQLHGRDFYRGCRELEIRDAKELGFQLPFGTENLYPVLTAVWQDIIEDRLRHPMPLLPLPSRAREAQVS